MALIIALSDRVWLLLATCILELATMIFSDDGERLTENLV